MKKIIMMIILGIILSSCGTLGLARYGIEETIRDGESEKRSKILREKEAGGSGEKDEKIVEEAIKNISTRSINKRVQFGETTLLIPEKTRINPKVGNIVDEKTGYGIPIIFSKESGCSSVFYSKRLSNNNYIELFYNRKNTRLNEIINKLVRANGFTRTCN